MNNYKKRTFDRENGVPIEAECSLIAHADSRNRSAGRLANARHWTEIDVYQTRAGVYLLRISGRTNVHGHTNRIKVDICNDIDTLKFILGKGWLAHEIGKQMGITITQEVK